MVKKLGDFSGKIPSKSRSGVSREYCTVLNRLGKSETCVQSTYPHDYLNKHDLIEDCLDDTVIHQKDIHVRQSELSENNPERGFI